MLAKHSAVWRRTISPRSSRRSRATWHSYVCGRCLRAARRWATSQRLSSTSAAETPAGSRATC
eukprot:4871870-Prymnesium_polylepis.1